MNRDDAMAGRPRLVRREHTELAIAHRIEDARDEGYCQNDEKRPREGGAGVNIDGRALTPRAMAGERGEAVVDEGVVDAVRFRSRR